jgi:hypothetical protein
MNRTESNEQYSFNMCLNFSLFKKPEPHKRDAALQHCIVWEGARDSTGVGTNSRLQSVELLFAHLSTLTSSLALPLMPLAGLLSF